MSPPPPVRDAARRILDAESEADETPSTWRPLTFETRTMPMAGRSLAALLVVARTLPP
jgi:hypothetical protein